MQDLLADLFWRDPTIPEAISRFLRTIPAYRRAERNYAAAEARIRAAVEPELFREYERCLLEYTSYEMCAYYAFGADLRRELIRALNL